MMMMMTCHKVVKQITDMNKKSGAKMNAVLNITLPCYCVIIQRQTNSVTRHQYDYKHLSAVRQ